MQDFRVAIKRRELVEALLRSRAVLSIRLIYLYRLALNRLPLMLIGSPGLLPAIRQRFTAVNLCRRLRVAPNPYPNPNSLPL
jgi:hypothetical protein